MSTVNYTDIPLVTLSNDLFAFTISLSVFLGKELIYHLNKAVNHFDSCDGLAPILMASHSAVQTIIF